VSAFIDKFAGINSRTPVHFRQFVDKHLDGSRAEIESADSRANEHWRSQAAFAGLERGLRFDHVWRFEDIAALPEEATLGAAGAPRGSWCGGFGEGGRYSFAESMRPEHHNWHGHHVAVLDLSQFWTGRQLLALGRARPIEAKLLWPVYQAEYEELAGRLGVLGELRMQQNSQD